MTQTCTLMKDITPHPVLKKSDQTGVARSSGSFMRTNSTINDNQIPDVTPKPPKTPNTDHKDTVSGFITRQAEYRNISVRNAIKRGNVTPLMLAILPNRYEEHPTKTEYTIIERLTYCSPNMHDANARVISL